MENATEAFKMGFAVLVLVFALTLAIYSFTRVRETSARITDEADARQYYEQLTLDENINSVNSLSNRVVGIETVIPTLYRYYKENYTVLFYKGEGYNSESGTFERITPMTIYYTETDKTYLSSSTLAVNNDYRGIYGFDIQDEQVRREPWSANQETAYNFIKEFVNNLTGNSKQKYYSSKINSTAVELSNKNNYYLDSDPLGPYYTMNFYFNGTKIADGGFVGKDYKFVERYGEYAFGYGEKVNDSIVLDNNEIARFDAVNKKRIIQYIFIN